MRGANFHSSIHLYGVNRIKYNGTVRISLASINRVGRIFQCSESEYIKVRLGNKGLDVYLLRHLCAVVFLNHNVVQIRNPCKTVR